MKSRVLMAALIVTLLMGARIYAGDCGPCDPACDPCGGCYGCTKSCDLFSGLKSLVACKPCAVTECGPCDAIVACSPCDVIDCEPCCDVGCVDSCCSPKFAFGFRLKKFFAVSHCDPCGPCEVECNPCDVVDCNPCEDVCCDTGCYVPQFTFKKLFAGFHFGKCGTGCCDPCGGCCDIECGPCDADCGPCDVTCCDAICAPCDADCGPCDVTCCDTGCCDTGCGHKFGRLFDKPRYRVKKFFDGFFGVGRGSCCEVDCNPCEPVCNPCDVVCEPCASCCGGYVVPAVVPAASQLPEVVN